MPRFKINVSDFTRRPPTIGETLEFERVSGVGFRKLDWLQLNDPEGIPAAVAVGMIWVLRKRTHPQFTLRELYDLDWADVELVVDEDALPAAQNGHDGDENPSSRTTAEPAVLTRLREDASRRTSGAGG